MFNLHKVDAPRPDAGRRDVHDRTTPTSSSRDNLDFHPTDVHRRRRRQPAGRRHRRLVQALLPDLAARKAGRARRRSIASAASARRDVQDPRGRTLAWKTMDCCESGSAARRCATPPSRIARCASWPRRDRCHGRCDRCARPCVEHESPSADARRNAVWALTRIDRRPRRGAQSGTRLERSRRKRSGMRRMHAAGLLRDRGAVGRISRPRCNPASPAIQRIAAEALGRIGDSSARSGLDRGLPVRRSIACSSTRSPTPLIEINDPRSDARQDCRRPSSRSRRTALIALDQMDRHTLQASIRRAAARFVRPGAQGHGVVDCRPSS